MSAGSTPSATPAKAAPGPDRPFEVRAEVLKLARLLQRDPESLSYLEQLPLDDLRELREQTTDVLFSANQKTLVRLAGASKLLPAGIIAAISQHAFGRCSRGAWPGCSNRRGRSRWQGSSQPRSSPTSPSSSTPGAPVT